MLIKEMIVHDCSKARLIVVVPPAFVSAATGTKPICRKTVPTPEPTRTVSKHGWDPVQPVSFEVVGSYVNVGSAATDPATVLMDHAEKTSVSAS